MITAVTIVTMGGPAAAGARKMSTEFISEDEADYGNGLKHFIAEH